MIDHQSIRTWILLFTPPMLLCVLPNWLGITEVKSDMATFRFWFDSFVTLCFFSGVAYAIYAVIHNANVRSKNHAR